jgi:uncharacterized protein YjeT (DUF2065 family)
MLARKVLLLLEPFCPLVLVVLGIGFSFLPKQARTAILSCHGWDDTFSWDGHGGVPP